MNVQTLIKQLGTALPMMGARDLVACPDALMFSVGRNPNGISKVIISLRADDTYTVSAVKGRGLKAQPAGDLDGVYADGLHAALKSLTGLDTRL